jgi:5,10-methylenetetrahydromethanopterin reductase
VTEFGVVHMPMPGLGAELARSAEDMGFDACLFTDTQLLAGDPFAEACLAARATTRIRLGTGVTNPVTRAIATIASAIATVHVESGGRAILGLGRGDSAAAQAGRRPAGPGELEAGVRELRAHLSPQGIGWLAAAGLPSVPLDVACTGPRTIAVAARTGDRVSFAVGASPERLEWAVATARRAVAECGRDQDAVQLGAYLNVVVDADAARARRHARSGVGVLAHFTAMDRRPAAVPERHRPVLDGLREHYEMDRHTRTDSRQSRLLSEEFVDWFAIAGEPGYCRERLAGLLGLGLGHVYLIGGAADPSPLAVLEAERLFAKHVMPGLRP